MANELQDVVVSCHVMPWVMTCHVMSCHDMPCHVVSCHVLFKLDEKNCQKTTRTLNYPSDVVLKIVQVGCKNLPKNDQDTKLPVRWLDYGYWWVLAGTGGGRVRGPCCRTCAGPMLWDVFGVHVVGRVRETNSGMQDPNKDVPLVLITSVGSGRVGSGRLRRAGLVD